MQQAEVAAHADDFGLRDELVARDDGVLEFDMLHAAEHRDLAAMLLRIQHRDAADLRHGLEDQDARHDRMAGEMTDELRLDHRDVLDACRRLERLNLEDAINKQHRRTMRQDLHDFRNA